MITGKTKQEFEKWWNIDHIKHKLEDFYDLPKSMQYGVLVDYFDSVGVIIETPFYWGGNWWKYEISTRELSCSEEEYVTNLRASKEGFKTRPEARPEAIKKANEIRNKQLKGNKHVYSFDIKETLKPFGRL
tara:strand:+ start:752 stop:1144 length:393 start_codon:yes stop_codon:yes gene_type:complete